MTNQSLRHENVSSHLRLNCKSHLTPVLTLITDQSTYIVGVNIKICKSVSIYQHSVLHLGGSLPVWAIYLFPCVFVIALSPFVFVYEEDKVLSCLV